MSVACTLLYCQWVLRHATVSVCAVAKHPPANPPANCYRQVDAFELAVETPPAPKARGQVVAQAQAERRTPPRALQAAVGQALAAAAPTPGTALRQQRAMSLGLSRRRSSMVAWPVPAALASSSKANQSPLKLNVPPRAMQE